MDMVRMQQGSDVPKVCVDALTEFEKTWPGASFPMARPKIVQIVLETYKKEVEKNE